MVLVLTGLPGARAAVHCVPDSGIDPSCDAGHATIQGAVDGAIDGDTVLVAAGTYAERLVISKSINLLGAQNGVDPTPAGARMVPADESIVTEQGLPNVNPEVLIEVANGTTGVTIDGFTLQGEPLHPNVDECAVRVWDDDVAIRNNIMEGARGVLYKGADNLVVSGNRMVVNKNGLVVQPYAATNVTISGNIFSLGANPHGDESAVYMSSCDSCAVIDNRATGFVNAKGLAGSSLSNLMVAGNVFTGSKDAISIWGNSTFITISGNELSASVRFGISIKGQDILIIDNGITNSGSVGINIDRHVIDTERVTITGNEIAGNVDYGVKVNTANVFDTVNAIGNTWDPTANGANASGLFPAGTTFSAAPLVSGKNVRLTQGGSTSYHLILVAAP